MEEDRTEIIETPPTTREVRDVNTGPRTSEVRDVTTAPRTTEVHSYTPPRTEAAQIESMAYDPYEGRRAAAYRLTQLVYWVFGLVEGLIVIRLILKALGANPSAGFSQFIYGITAPLIAPFVGLFNNPSYQNSVLELSAIVALIVYALLAWLLAKLVWILVGETRSAVRTHSHQMDSRV
jgi:YggT family protein